MNIWEKIKLILQRKPAGNIYKSYGGDKLTESTYKIDPPLKTPK
jgi:hypothetical protein